MIVGGRQLRPPVIRGPLRNKEQNGENTELWGRVHTDRTGTHFIHEGLSSEKEEGWSVGEGEGEGSDLLWPLCQLSLQLFIRLQTCTLPKSGPRLQQNKLVHTSGMSPSSTVQNVVQKELLHIGGVHSCRVGSLFRPRGETLPPQLLVAERLCEGKMLSQREEEKKSPLFI